MFTEEETQMVYDRQNATLQAAGTVSTPYWRDTEELLMNSSQALPFTFEQLSEWYNGYSTLDGTKLYKPWSIGKALTKGSLGPYWAESG